MALTFRLAFCACSQAIYQSLLLLPLKTQSGPQGGGLWGWGNQGSGGASGTVVGIHMWDVPSGLWAGFLIESVKQLVGSISLEYSFLFATKFPFNIMNSFFLRFPTRIFYLILPLTVLSEKERMQWTVLFSGMRDKNIYTWTQLL